MGFSMVAYFLSPWVLALFLVPHFPAMLGEVPTRTMPRTLLYGIGWGLGALSMGIAYRFVGMAITYAIVLGLSSSIGTLVPLIVLAPERIRTRQGLSVIASVLIALVGTVVVAWAAWERDARKSSAKVAPAEAAGRNLFLGLGLCVSSGILSSFGNLGFAFGEQFSRRAAALGAGPLGSGCAVWSVLCFPVFLCNFTYSLYLLRTNKTGSRFREQGTGYYWGWAILMGALWMGGMAAYGAGALALGKLGTSMGWILFMCSNIITGNVLGVLTYEWRGSGKRTMAIMAGGVAILIAVVILVGVSGAA
jgi:L-rhamnose-H+ transport protein